MILINRIKLWIGRNSALLLKGASLLLSLYLGGEGQAFAVCMRMNPQIIFEQPDQLSSVAGQQLFYQFSLRNVDTPDCGSSTFNLSIDSTPGIFPYLEVKSYVLSPGQTVKAVLIVGSAPFLPDGTYTSLVSFRNVTTGTQVSTALARYFLNTSPQSKCTRLSAILEIKPLDQLAIQSAQGLKYSVSISNRDTAACGLSRFDVSIYSSHGLNAALVSNSVSVEPGQVGTIPVTIAGNLGLADGIYPFAAGAWNQSAGSFLISQPGTYILNTSPSTRCTRLVPAVEFIQPQLSAGRAGQALTYVAKVTNKDTAGCPAARMGLTAEVQSGLAPYIEIKTLTLNPGQTSTVNLVVGSAPALGDGNYRVALIAQNAALPDKRTVAEGIYQLLTTPVPSCVRARPTVNFREAHQLSSQVGQQLFYTANIINNDSLPCGASNFSVVSQVQAGLSPYLEVKNLKLEPGQKDIVLMIVGSAPQLPDGKYSLGIDLNRQEGAAFGGSGVGYYYKNSSPTAVCTRLKPSVNLSHSRKDATAAGASLSYIASIKNEDTLACGSSQFALSIESVSGLVPSIESTSLVLRPGESKGIELKISSQVTLSDGKYPFSVRVINPSNPDLTGLVGTSNGIYTLKRSATPVDPQAQYRPYATELLSLLDPASKEYTEVKKWADQGNFVQAMKSYRDLVVYRFRSIDFAQFSPKSHELNPGEVILAEMLVGKMSYTQYLANYSVSQGFIDYFGLRGNPHDSQPIQWFPSGGTPDNSHLYCPFTLPVQLARQYQLSGDPLYLEKWFQIFSDFSRNQKSQWLQLNPAIQPQMICGWESGYVMDRIVYSMRTLGAFTKLLPGGNAPRKWLDVLAPQSGVLPASSLDMIPELDIFQMMKSWVDDYPPILLKRYVPPRFPPSHRDTALQAFGMLLHLTSDFKRSQELTPRFLGSSKDDDCEFCGGMLGETNTEFYPDGGLLERSFGYMTGTLTNTKAYIKLYLPNPPDWIQAISVHLSRAQKVFAALTTPFQDLPRVHYVGRTPPPLWKTPELWTPWLNASLEAEKAANSIRVCNESLVDCFEAPSNSSPAFSSIGFPYVGYYAMRKNWGTQSPYLFFTNGAFSRGHQSANVNSIEMIAYGRQLLAMPAAQYGEYTSEKGLSDYFEETNTFRTNTVVVNGQQQFGYSVVNNYDSMQAEASKTPMQTRWTTTPYFDFTEGWHSWGYGPPGSYSVTNRDFNHQRQVIFVRELEAWVVVDQMIPNTPTAVGSFTQLWHFPPFVPNESGAYGFTNDQVVVNSAERRFYTQDSASNAMDGPNLSLFQFGTLNLDYAKYYGSRTARIPGVNQDFYAGWHSPLYPESDVWVNWTGGGKQQLVTLLVPNPAQNPHSDFRDPTLRNEIISFVDRKDLSSGTISGFSVTQPNGSTLGFLSSLESNRLELKAIPQVGTIAIQGITHLAPQRPVAVQGGATIPQGNLLQGNTLLIRYDSQKPGGKVTGLALGVQQFTVAGRLQPYTGDFVFELRMNSQTGVYEAIKISDIKIPTGFDWTRTHQGLVPRK